MTVRDVLLVLDEAGLRVDAAMPAASGAWVDAPVAGIAHDSRTVRPGTVFAALRGQRADGAAFVTQAAANGAVAILSDQDRPAGVGLPWIRVTDSRLALALAAAAFYGHPSRQLTVVGITGTNGKTTTAYLVRAVFEAAGHPCGLVGTVQYLVGGRAVAASRTTPEAVELQRMLREMSDAGCTACAMEASSHALALRRVDGTRFSAGLFTNLTRDHLDFHDDMDGYFAAKRRLFDMLPSSAPGIFNVDDRRGVVLADACPNRVTFAIERPADVTPGPVSPALDGLRFEARTPAGSVNIRSPLVGRFNLYNLLGVVAAGVALGLPGDAIERGLGAVEAVPGRLQVASSTVDDDLTVIVDYAHTDDALRNLLEAVRPLATARLVTVFGCGGDRDRTKRPLMGAVAARLSDLVALTSDNPRSEDPEGIIDDIERGLSSPDMRHPGADAEWRPSDSRAAYLRVPDRREAIERVIADAGAGDVIVIAGKGHEQYQELGGRVVPFDDVAVARGALAQRRHRRAS